MDQILDAKIHRVKTSADRKIMMEELAENLRNAGRRPYIIPTGGSNKIGVLGYVLCLQEIAQQSSNMDVVFDYFIHPTGSAGTQAGILIGKKLYYPEMDIIGIGVGDSKKELMKEIRKIITDFEQEWNNNLAISDSEIIVMDQYSGEGYGVPNKEMIDTVKLVAKLEGIFLDPVYNGKAMVGLIDLVKSEEIPADSSVLFLHSGGGPALFSYSDVFSKKI